MIIAIANYKGGVGKTTTAINLAYDLAVVHENNVLVIDADSSRNLSVFFDRYDESKPGLCEILAAEKNMRNRGVIRRTKYRNLDIIQASKALRGFTYKSPILLFERDWMKKNYDYVVIDCHPDFNVVTESVIMAADKVIVPIKVDRNAINGLELMSEGLDMIEDYRINAFPKINFETDTKVLITMYQPNRIVRKGIEELLRTTEFPIFDSVIRNTCKCAESIDKKKPLLKCASKSSACVDYLGLAEEIVKGGI